MSNILKKVVIPIITGLILICWSVFAMGSSAHADTNEKVYYYLHDHLGGIGAVTDEEGKIVERRDYLPYGNERLRIEQDPQPSPQPSPQSSPQPENYGFTGKELDEETGLYYYGARYYDPTIARFTQIDPLVLGESSKSLKSVLANPQALNSYSYVLNNPVRFIDDNGEYTDEIHYTLTYYLGLKAGLSDTVANEIAFFDDRMDTNPNTAPRGSLTTLEGIKLSIKNVFQGTTKKYHFVPQPEAWNGVKNAIKSGDARTLGASLHTYQDSFSHGIANLSIVQHSILTKAEEYAYSLLGLSIGTDPDKSQNNVYYATQMAIDTFVALRQFKFNELNLTKTEDIQAFKDETNKILGENINDVIDFLSFEIKSVSEVADVTNKNDDDK